MLSVMGISMKIYAQDTTKIVMGEKVIWVIESNGNDEVILDGFNDSLDMEDWDWDYDDGCGPNLAHWGGFEMGVNGFLNSNNTTEMTNNAWELDYARSFVFNLHPFEKKFNLFKGHVGFVTGLGFSFHNYQFKGSTNLFADADTTYAFTDTIISYDKNKLKAAYVKIPLLLEINTSLDPDKTFHIAGGVEAGFRMSSKMKYKYEFEDEKYKIKAKGHYNLNPWKISAVARVGYRNVTFFANYSLTPLFEKGAGPELYPFEVGLTLIPF